MRKASKIFRSCNNIADNELKEQCTPVQRQKNMKIQKYVMKTDSGGGGGFCQELTIFIDLST